MKILFLTNPYIIDPLGIGYLSSILKKDEHQIDLELISEWEYKCSIFHPDVVAFSITTGQHQDYTNIARKIKNLYPKVIIIFGGPHPTYFPHADDCVDYIVQGEADTSFPRLLKRIKSGEQNIERIIKPECLVQNLDEIPMPDRTLIYKFPQNAKNPIRNIMTSRGCPFSCPYCYNGTYKELYKGQKIVRVHSIDRVIAECIDVRDNHGAKFIFFIDDEFSMNDKRLEELCARYKKEVNIPYHAQLRIDLLTEKKAKILKDSGCISVTFAIESGGEKYRKEMLHRDMTDKQIIDGAKLLHKYGILFRTENMIGLPFESFSDAMNTLNLNIKCRPELAWASLYQPYAGTPLGNLCIEKGLFSGTVDDIKATFFEDSVLPLPNKKRFVNLQRLFGLVVSFPILKWILPLALRVPTNKFYSFLYAKWKKNRYDKKLYKFGGE